MPRLRASLALTSLAALAGVALGCARSDCVEERHLATEKGIVAECVTAADVRVIAAVRECLARDLATDAATTIHVSATAGVVTLTGQVADESRRHRAEKLAYGVDGVDQVENKLVVVGEPQNPRAYGAD